ncbi:molybdopterin-dependent oxidoreductase [Rhizobium sp. NPDC090275]|uniref:molybdopterin-dependent oxidoreductase n=1 Tax=Rhizobium sp. NPDC090275 TaxID=3364498 RepID=UPI003839E704
MTMSRFMAAAAAVCLIAVPGANALDRPTGDVVLTISGTMDEPNVGNTAQFDLAMLEKLQGRTGTMVTPWTDGKRTFSGPLLRAVLDAAHVHGRTLKVTALNDYSADVPVDDATTLDTMLATRVDGKLISVRDKGPLFLIYPFDKQPDIYNEKYFSRSVWQIKAIEVEQ